MVFHYQKFNILDYIQYHLGSTILGLNEKERKSPFTDFRASFAHEVTQSVSVVLGTEVKK